MGLLDNLERGLERVVRSAFSAGGPRAVKPVEIASALRQAMDDESIALSEGHTVAPNSYVVHFSPPTSSAPARGVHPRQRAVR